MSQLRPPVPRRLSPAQRVAIDGAATALMVVVYGLVFGEPAFLTGIPQWAAAGIVAAAVLPAAARRRWPRSALAVVAVAGVVAVSVSREPACRSLPLLSST